jgi:prepilin-type N-terminal cleavage/methylation domain-containing protein
MRGERGYTLVEMLVATAVFGFIATVLGLVVQQVATVPERSGDQVEALHAVQNAAYWISLEGQMAKSATGGPSLILTFPDDSVISYSVSDGTLSRHQGAESRMIAENISSLNFAVDDRVITMNIIAAPDSRWDTSENQTYQIVMRPTG